MSTDTLQSLAIVLLGIGLLVQAVLLRSMGRFVADLVQYVINQEEN